jgi:hypothetical protein
MDQRLFRDAGRRAEQHSVTAEFHQTGRADAKWFVGRFNCSYREAVFGIFGLQAYEEVR